LLTVLESHGFYMQKSAKFFQNGHLRKSTYTCKCIFFHFKNKYAHNLYAFNPLSAKKVLSESDFMPVRTSPSSSAASYHFSISPTCGFAFPLVVLLSEIFVFMWRYTPHPALSGLTALYTSFPANSQIQYVISHRYSLD